MARTDEVSSPGEIVVNVTAARHSGALSVITQFLQQAEQNKDFKFYVFVTAPELLKFDQHNIRIITLAKTQNTLSRIWWDFLGIKARIKQLNIQPVAAISFQNTGFKLSKKIPQIIYYHQSAPFSKIYWNPFKKGDRVFWLYKWIYPYFTKWTIHASTYFVVQTQWIKTGIMDVFKVPEERITIVKPSIQLIASTPVPDVSRQFPPLRIFYPATATSNKNHIEIVKAVCHLNRSGKLHRDLKIIFTCDKLEEYEFVRIIIREKLDDYFEFIGHITFEEVQQQYEVAHLMLFPSKLETFGIPLLEAATKGLRIIAIDQSYAREVLENYEGASFVPLGATVEWANAIFEVMENNKRYPPFKPSYKNEWYKIFDLLKQITT